MNRTELKAKWVELKQDAYFDVVGCSPSEQLIENITKAVAGTLIAVFSLSELKTELATYRLNRKASYGN